MAFNIYDHVDPVFPEFTPKEVEAKEMIAEACAPEKAKEPEDKPKEKTKEEPVMEAADDSTTASMAMSAVLAWVDGGDCSYTALSEYAAGIADLDGNEDLSDDEMALFNDIMTSCADALVSLGASSGDVDTFLNGEDDAAGETVCSAVSETVDQESASDEDMIDGFATGGVMEGVFEASFKKMRVVRDGKLKIVKKRLGKVILSAAQKAGLKKARRKAFTSVARMARKKSMKIRKQHGM